MNALDKAVLVFAVCLIAIMSGTPRSFHLPKRWVSAPEREGLTRVCVLFCSFGCRWVSGMVLHSILFGLRTKVPRAHLPPPLAPNATAPLPASTGAAALTLSKSDLAALRAIDSKVERLTHATEQRLLRMEQKLDALCALLKVVHDEVRFVANTTKRWDEEWEEADAVEEKESAAKTPNAAAPTTPNNGGRLQQTEHIQSEAQPKPQTKRRNDSVLPRPPSASGGTGASAARSPSVASNRSAPTNRSPQSKPQSKPNTTKSQTTQKCKSIPSYFRCLQTSPSGRMVAGFVLVKDYWQNLFANELQVPLKTALNYAEVCSLCAFCSTQFSSSHSGWLLTAFASDVFEGAH